MGQDLIVRANSAPYGESASGSSDRVIVRNVANSADNLALTDAGALTVRAGVTVTAGGQTITAGGLTITDGDLTISSGRALVTPGANSGTPATSAGSLFNVATSTFTDSATAMSGTATAFAAYSFNAPTLAATNTSVTTTNSATVYIDAAPIAGTNETLTNTYALWVDGGAVRLDGNLSFVAQSQALIVGPSTELLFRNNANGTSLLALSNQGQARFAPEPVSGTPATTGSYFNVATTTFTDNNTAMSATAAAFVSNAFKAPTLAATNSSVTTTDAATLYIDAAPIAGTNQTLTNAWALWVDGGNCRFDGAVVAQAATAIPAGGTTGAGFRFSSTANLGLFFGSGAPTLTAAQGALYIRTDGSSASTRLYSNSDGGTTWVAMTSAS